MKYMVAIVGFLICSLGVFFLFAVPIAFAAGIGGKKIGDHPTSVAFLTGISVLLAIPSGVYSYMATLRRYKSKARDKVEPTA